MQEIQEIPEELNIRLINFRCLNRKQSRGHIILKKIKAGQKMS